MEEGSEGSVRGVPLSEIIDDVAQRVAQSELFEEHPYEAWISTIESIEGMIQFYSERVHPDRIKLLAHQVGALRAVIEAFKIEAIQTLVFEKAMKAGISYPEMLMKLEQREENNGAEG
jgi:hypothetical protein